MYRGATPLDEAHGSGRGTQRRNPLLHTDARLYVEAHASVTQKSVTDYKNLQKTVINSNLHHNSLKHHKNDF